MKSSPEAGVQAKLRVLRRKLPPGLFPSLLLDISVACVCFLASWKARASFPRVSPESPLPCQGPSGWKTTSLHLLSPAEKDQMLQREKHRAQLIEQVTKHARGGVVDKCVAIVKGESMESFAQGKQDWVLYHTFFSHLKHGEGYYIDAGANDPENGSNTFFFDACLGWKGICLEPNPMYEEAFRAKRTCKHLKNCLAGKEETLVLADADKGTKGFVQRNGTGLSVVCRRLQDILVEEEVGRVELGQRRVDLVSLDIEGQEYNSLKCFPFDAFDMPLWLVETRHQLGYSLNSVFGSAGYWMSPMILVPYSKSLPRHLGARQDNIFVRWARPSKPTREPPFDNNATTSPSIIPRESLVPRLILGPDFLPGRALYGAAFQPPCGKHGPCRQTVPSIDLAFEYKRRDFVHGECPSFGGVRHRLSREH